MKKFFLFGVVGLFLVFGVLGLSLPLWSVQLGNPFVGQSGDFVVSGMVFESEHCVRYANIVVPENFTIFFPVIPGYVVGVLDGENISVQNANELVWAGGEVFVSGNNLTFHIDQGDDPNCLQGSDSAFQLVFYKNFLTNPSVEGAYLFEASVVLSNDLTVYNLTPSLVLVGDSFSTFNYGLNVSYNYDSFVCNVSTVLGNDSFFTFVNVSLNNSVVQNFSFMTFVNNSFVTNVSVLSFNNFSCGGVSNNLSFVFNNSPVLFCNGSTFVNVSSDVLFNMSLFDNSTTTFSFSNGFNNSFNLSFVFGDNNFHNSFDLVNYWNISSPMDFENWNTNNFGLNVSCNSSVVCGNVSVSCSEIPPSDNGFLIFLGLVLGCAIIGGVLLFSRFYTQGFGVKPSSPADSFEVASPKSKIKSDDVVKPIEPLKFESLGKK